MALQSLTPPQDITWTRLGYSRDMIDTNFGDLNFPPRWRTSMTVYYYIVPDEETADAYPNTRIVYLKLSCSITGYNPNEDLLEALKIEQEQDRLDDLQKSIWEVIQTKGWAEKYWPCLGAVMQLAVYPRQRDGISPDDYPYIMDFEPKKRELFEQVTEGSEILSSSSDKISTTKGSTNTQSVEASIKVEPFWGVFGESTLKAGASWQQVNNKTTDSIQEDRMTKSHSASFSQMYQLFNGYHLGTNRALFLVNPRPHTASSDSGSVSQYGMINGERKLEGIQEVFLVVNLPRVHDGFCIQAGIDTAHKVTESSFMYLALRMNDNQNPPDWDDPTTPVPPDWPPVPPATVSDHLVITRRIIQGCGLFDENGNFQVQKVPDTGVKKPPVVTGEFLAQKLPAAMAIYKSVSNPEFQGETKARLAHELNIRQSQIAKSLIDTYTAGNYKPRSITETASFKALVATAITNLDVPVQKLRELKYISDEEEKLLVRYKIQTVGDLFKETTDKMIDIDIDAIRKKIIR